MDQFLSIARYESEKILFCLDLGHVFHLHRIAEIAGNRLVERDAVMQQLLETPDGEAIGIDLAILGDRPGLLVFGPFLIEEARLIIHRFGHFAETLDQHAGMRGRSLDIEKQRIVGEALEDRITEILRIDDLAQAAP
jgi:hypothetical protein